MHHALNGAVVKEHIRILCTGVKILQRQVHGGKVVAVVGQVRKNIITARHLDHLGHIVAALAHIGKVVGCDGEKSTALAGGSLPGQRCKALHLPGEFLFRQLLFPQQDAPELEPFQPGQRAALIAGALHQHRDAKPFQLLLDLRGVVDHGVLDGKAAVGRKDLFIVRGAVLARIGNAPGLHGGSGLIQIPALRLGTGKSHTVQPIQREEQVHHRGGDKVDVPDGLTQHRHALGQAFHLSGILRGHKELLPRFGQGQHGIAALIAVGSKLCGVIQRTGMVKDQFFCAGGRCLGGGATRQSQYCSRQNAQELLSRQFHQFSAKVSVYSISWGVLMATVSAVTASGVPSAETGISKVEFPSVLVGRYFSPSTIM